MFKIRYIILLMSILLACTSLPTQAQDSSTSKASIPIDINDAVGSVDILHEMETVADVELNIGDQIYQLSIPVTVKIDTTTLLADAKRATDVTNQVGSFSFEPVSIEVIEGEYEKDYRSVTPSGSDNVIVVYTAKITNLHDETMDLAYSSVFETLAIDETGNTYEEAESVCNDVDPNETTTCEFIFDVPATANLVDMEVKTVAYKRFSFGNTGTTN